jgi:hypothetical protein
MAATPLGETQPGENGFDLQVELGFDAESVDLALSFGVDQVVFKSAMATMNATMGDSNPAPPVHLEFRTRDGGDLCNAACLGQLDIGSRFDSRADHRTGGGDLGRDGHGVHADDGRPWRELRLGDVSARCVVYSSRALSISFTALV